MKNSREGVIFGSPGVDRLNRLIKSQKGINFRVYSPDGNLIGKTTLVEIKNDRRTCRFKSKINIPKNSLAQYDFNEYFIKNKNQLNVYNADDGVSVSTMLSIISENLKSEYDVFWVFSLYEEVHQITSWHISKNNTLKINKDDLFLNLECQKVANVNPKYPSSDYKKGVILQLSNTGCLFGYKSDKKNLTETLIRESAKQNKTKIQIGLIKDSCDSRPISYFNLTSNIATLNIPNEHKHNENGDGEIVLEKISLDDLINFYKIIKTALMVNPETLINSKETNLSYEIKKNDDITDVGLMESKANLNRRLALAYLPIVNRGYYFPVNTKDYLLDTISKILFYTIFLIQKFRI